MKKIFPILAIFSLFQSCRRDDTIPYCDLHQDDCYDVEEVKDFLFFQEGSYWVYEEETSGEIDSVYVTEAIVDTNSFYFSTTVYSQFNGYFYRYWPILGTSGCPTSGLVQNGFRCLHVKKSKTKLGDFVSEKYAFFYSDEIGGTMTNWTIPVPDNKIIFDSMIPEYYLEADTFYNVLVFDEEYNETEENQSTKHYYSLFHGLIRKELIDSGQVWNLVNYGLIQ